MFEVIENKNKEYSLEEIKFPKYNDKDVVLIIDGDILSYKVAAVTEKTSISVTNPKGLQRSFKTRTELKDFLKSKDKLSELPNYQVEDVQEPAQISHCLSTVNNAIKNAMNRVGANKFEIYIGGSGNFRDELPLPVAYKGSEARKRVKRPVRLNEIKDHLINHKSAIKVKGVEADDVVQYRTEFLLESGIDCILYSNDKDATQSQKLFKIYNPDTDQVTTYNNPIGEIHWHGSKQNTIKGSGLKFLIYQILIGDTIDNYFMKSLRKVKYGDKSFYKDFNDLKTCNSVLGKAVELLKSWFPEPITYQCWKGETHTKDWMEIAELYFSCAYMKTKLNDKTCFKDLLKEYQILEDDFIYE